MKDYLKHVPGFRSDTKWKKIVASIFYVLHILMSFIIGLDYFLLVGGFALLIFTLAQLFGSVRNKKSLKKPAILFMATLVLLTSGVSVSEEKEAKVREVEKIKLAQEQKIADEKEAEIKEQERIKLEQEQERKAEEEKKQVEFEKNFVAAEVTKHVDGDTVHVTTDNGEVLKIRMIGIDTPETVHPSKPVEFYGKEASDFTEDKIFGKTIYLEKDVSNTDKYDRALRYIWLEIPRYDEINQETVKNKMFNGMLVAQGYANNSTYQPDVKYQDYFLELEREAREQSVGLWDETKLAEYEQQQEQAKIDKEKEEARKAEEEKKAKEAEAAKAKQSASTNNSSSSNNSNNNSNQEVTKKAPAQQGVDNTAEILRTKTGTKYHGRKCGNGNFYGTTLEDAKAAGLTACSKCF